MFGPLQDCKTLLKFYRGTNFDCVPLHIFHDIIYFREPISMSVA